MWRPQPGPQKALIDCPLPEIFYGGARGGGKTDGVLGKFALKEAAYGEHFNAVFFRKELPMLDDAIERAHQIYGPLGGEWNEQKKTWRMPNGGRLRFRPLERIQDAEKYQGQNISDACVEEAGNYADPRPIDRLNGVLRSVHGVPTQLLLTGNPGGAGQHWIKTRYINPAPKGMKILGRKLPNGAEHRYVFIPSRLENNRMLIQNDPEYVNRLYLVGSSELVRAWLEGDWNAVEGAFFDCWTSRIILDPFEIPEHWARLRSLDWGSASPFSVGWWAVSSEDIEQNAQIIPRGSLIRYREWYGIREENGQIIPNTGLKLTAEEVGEGIAKRSKDDPQPAYSVADPSAFSMSGGPSIMERLMKAEKKILGEKFRFWRQADNRRVSGKGFLGGWDQMRQRIKGVDDMPLIYCFHTCANSIRTIPVLQHDQTRPEDLDTDSEDHAADDWRYACMSRPMPKDKVTQIQRPITAQPSLGEMLERHDRRHRK